MKRLAFAVIVIPFFLFCFAGCAAFRTDMAKVEADFKSFDLSTASKYWADFVNGLDVALQLTESVAGNVDVGNGVKLGQVIETTAKPLVSKANDSVIALTAVAAGLQAGTATVADAQAALTQVKNDVISANAVVGQVQAQVSTKTAAVPTRSALQ